MDRDTITILGVILSNAIAVLSFARGGSGKTTNEAERWGAFNKEMEYVRKDLDEIKGLVGQNSRDTKDSIRRVHERMDEHLRREHGQVVPERSG